jgi:hypothetical protein
MSTALWWTVFRLHQQFPHSHPCCDYFLRCINCSWAAVLDTFGTTSSHDDVYT